MNALDRHSRRLTPRSSLLFLIPLLAGALAAAPAAGQAKRAPEKPAKADSTFEDTSGVVAVEVPVTVVGRDGQPVRGLTAADFEVFDEGKSQPITSFEVIDLTAIGPQDAAAGPLDAFESQARRHFLMLFDLSFSSPAAIVKARLAARDFVLNALRPTDLAAVATLSLEHGPKLVVTFTPDRAQLARGIDTLGTRAVFQADQKTDPLRFMIEPPGTAGTDLQVLGQSVTTDLRNDRVSAALLDYLNTLSIQGAKNQKMFDNSRVTAYSRMLGGMARKLDSVKGRKNILLFSEGFDSRLLLGRESGNTEQEKEAFDVAFGRIQDVDNDNRYGNTSLQTEINRMVEEFRRADCVIQAVDIGGLRAGGDITGAGRRTGKEALFFIANETGGELFEDTNNLGNQLGRVLARTSVTYLLSFERSDLKGDGAYHRLKVKGKLPSGARLSHRAGYYAPRPFQELDPLEKNLLASDGIATAEPRRDLDLNLLVAPFRASETLAYVPVIIEVGGRRLLDGHEDDTLALEIYAYVSNAQGEMRDFFVQQVSVGLGKSRALIRDTGVKYYGHLDLPPGNYRVRVLVRNADTGKTGVASAALDVPAFQSAQLELLPPLFFEAPGSWLLVREKDKAEQRTVVYPFTVKGEPYIPAAKPALSNQKPARLCLVAYNLGVGDLQVHGQVMASDGQALPGGNLALVERTATGIPGIDKLLATFETRGLKAGEYVLQVAVIDPATGHRETNSLPFAVVN